MACSSEGNHPLAIFKEPETYDSLKSALEDIRSDVGHLNCIEVSKVEYNIIFYLGGDWKFLALVTGINSAKSQYACIWCKCPNTERGDMDKTWYLTDPQFRARTVEENLSFSTLPKSRKQFNVSRQPLFPTIPLHRVVIDNQHLFLRISDVLKNHLIEELRREDAMIRLRSSLHSKFQSINTWKAIKGLLQIWAFLTITFG